MFYRDVRATREMEDEFDKMFKQVILGSLGVIGVRVLTAGGV